MLLTRLTPTAVVRNPSNGEAVELAQAVRPRAQLAAALARARRLPGAARRGAVRAARDTAAARAHAVPRGENSIQTYLIG